MLVSRGRNPLPFAALVGTGCAFSSLMANARRHQMFYVSDGLNAPAGAHCGTIQGSRGTPEIELPLERPVLQQSIDKAGVENVSRACGIHHGHRISTGVV